MLPQGKCHKVNDVTIVYVFRLSRCAEDYEKVMGRKTTVEVQGVIGQDTLRMKPPDSTDWNRAPSERRSDICLDVKRRVIIENAPKSIVEINTTNRAVTSEPSSFNNSSRKRSFTHRYKRGPKIYEIGLAAALAASCHSKAATEAYLRRDHVAAHEFYQKGSTRIE